MIEDLIETFARHEALAPAPEKVRVRIEAAASRRRLLRRSTAAVGGTLVAVLALVGVFFIRPDALSTGPVVGASASAASAAAHGPMTFLLVGTDKRPFDSSDLLRSDSITLVHLPAGSHTPYLISLSRYQVATFRGERMLFMDIFAIGGLSALSRAVREFTGLPVDGTVEVDFTGLIAVTDAVGGVDLCVDRRVTSVHTHRVYEPGCRRFDGADALDYLRQRRSLTGNDTDRQQHGRQYLKALYKKLAGADLQRIMNVIAAAGGAIRMDLGAYEIATVFAVASSISPDDVVSIAPPDTATGEQQLWAAVQGGTLTDWVVANPQQVDQR